MGAEPAAHPESGHRAQGQADRGVEEPHPFTEEKSTEDTGDLTRNGRDDDLKSLEDDEDDGRQEPPLAKSLFEEVLVNIQTDEEPVRGSVGDDEPGTVADDERRNAERDGPAVPGDQLRV